jgi:LysM repeat protein
VPSTTAQPTEHVVQRGETIGALAKKYGVTEQAILDANPNAKPRSLQVNDKLIIPAPVGGAVAERSLPAGGTGPATEGEIYVVKQGDNLTRIAGKYGITVKQLRAANNIKGDRILPKQRLVIPSRTPRPAPTNGAAPSGTF